MTDLTGDGYTRGNGPPGWGSWLATPDGLVKIPDSPAELEPPGFEVSPEGITFRWLDAGAPAEREGSPWSTGSN